MRFLVTGRTSGKTTKMIKWLEDNPEAICVVHSAMEADRLAREYKIDRQRFFTPGAVLFGTSINSKVGVDNLDLILGRLLRTNNEIDLVTATGNDYWDSHET